MQYVRKAPQTYDDIDNNLPRVFLAGSIEMGQAVDWQAEVTAVLEKTGIPHVILNPRRDDWDSSWEQSINNPEFKEQVTWEMDGIRDSDVVLMYFDPKTKSPISLLELGSLNDGTSVMICCPDGFWRKGNVEVVAEMYGHEVLNTMEEFLVAGRLALKHAFEINMVDIPTDGDEFD